MTKRISSRSFAAALTAQDRPAATPPGRRAQPVHPAVAVSVGMRLTGDDLQQLTAEQVEAVFEGVGRLAALGFGR